MFQNLRAVGATRYRPEAPLAATCGWNDPPLYHKSYRLPKDSRHSWFHRFWLQVAVGRYSRGHGLGWVQNHNTDSVPSQIRPLWSSAMALTWQFCAEAPLWSVSLLWCIELSSDVSV